MTEELHLRITRKGWRPGWEPCPQGGSHVPNLASKARGMTSALLAPQKSTPDPQGWAPAVVLLPACHNLLLEDGVVSQQLLPMATNYPCSGF